VPADEAVALRERLRMAHHALDVGAFGADEREQRVPHTKRVLAHDVHLAVVPEEQVVVGVYAAAERVLDGHDRVVHLAGDERAEDVVKRGARDCIDVKARRAALSRQREHLAGRRFAVRAAHALEGHAGGRHYHAEMPITF
jgi:hypothetical protein